MNHQPIHRTGLIWNVQVNQEVLQNISIVHPPPYPGAGPDGVKKQRITIF